LLVPFGVIGARAIAMAKKMGSITSVFIRNRELDVRHKILHGVYEENLHMLRRGSSPLKHHRYFRPDRIRRIKRILVPVLACVLSFLINNPGSRTSSSSAFSGNSIARGVDSSIAERSPADRVNATELEPLESAGSVPLYRMLSLGVQRIVIDAGHGGSDEGAVGKLGTMEKDITLDIAKKMCERLREGGFRNLFMTRTDDSDVSLQDRVKIAKEVKADLFVSIHVNSIPNYPANLIETFYFGPSRDAAILKLADRENKGSKYGLSDFKEIVERLGKTMKLQESRKLAESIQKSLVQKTREKNPHIRDNGVKRAPFAVLIGTDVPSVLAEVSCLSNTKEERALNSEKHRENIAEYLAAGVTNYLKTGALENEGNE
jgi:N-acetylmuramoyl-L-alanine amidase